MLASHTREHKYESLVAKLSYGNRFDRLRLFALESSQVHTDTIKSNKLNKTAIYVRSK